MPDEFEKPPEKLEPPSDAKGYAARAEFYDAHPDLIRPEHLNNFYMNIGEACRAQESSDFAMAVREAIQEVGMGLDDIRREYESFLTADSEKLRIRAELQQKLVPVYLALRAKGYTHAKLIA